MLKIIPTYSLADTYCTQTGRAIYQDIKKKTLSFKAEMNF